MNSINGLTTRLYSSSVEKTSSQAVTPTRVFSFLHAHSCEQRPQSHTENKTSSSFENKTG